jgi:tetratricopeptide (TPR) repeat protein
MNLFGRMIETSARAARLAALTILWIVGLCQPVPGQPADLRTITMRAAADETYRAQANWEANLRSTVATVSAIYEKNFQIRIVILDIAPWNAAGAAGRDGLNNTLMADVPAGRADVVVGFSNRCVRDAYGWTQVFSRFAIVTSGCYETITVKDLAPPDAVLSHELAHLFGAFHPARMGDSVMLGGPADRFDEQTIRVIRLTRGFDFSRGIVGVDAETRRAWSAIYAEGHARDEANPLAKAIVNEAWTMLHSGKVREGESALNDAITLDPSFARPHTLLGLLHSGRGQLEDAAREFQTAKSLDFREVGARTELGFVLLRLGKNEEALGEFREVLRVDPRLPRAYFGLGMAFWRLGKVENAIGAYDDAIRLDPKNALALGARGFAFQRKGAYAQAIQDYDQAIPLRPADATLLNNRCFSRAVTGKLQEALADCNESLRIRPNFPAALDSRGLVYLKLEQPERASADYDAALRLDPTLAHALYGRALARRRTGDLAGADADFAAARTLSQRIAEDYTAYGVKP